MGIQVCRRYIVPLAVIDGKVLAEMAITVDNENRGIGLQTLGLDQLLGCMKNLESVSKLIQQPGRQFMGPDGQEEVGTLEMPKP